MTHIRVATSLDRENIRKVHLSAFPEGERRLIATLAVNLLSEETTPETIALVAETDDAVVGHIAFSPVSVDTNENWRGYLLAPLGVRPEYQRRRIGSKLIENGIERLSNNGANVLLVYGDPKYYGKFGFEAETAANYLPPYELQYPFGWQAIVLRHEAPHERAVKISCVASLRDPELW
jgi:putative acetyltransferase